MRLALVSLVLLLLAVPIQAETGVVAGRPFVASPRASFLLDVEDAGVVQVTIRLLQGDAEQLTVSGPGRCTANVAIEMPDTVVLSCGWLTPGMYRLRLTVDGLGAQGSLAVQGATLSFTERV